MSFGPPNLNLLNQPAQPWTKRDTWKAVAYGICSAATITAALTLPQLAHAPQAPQPQPTAITQPALQR